MRINTNMAALNAWRTMTNNAGNLQKSLERLASGYRLNRAADDAAGLAVSEKMNAQIRGLGMALRNTQDAISLVQTAEGGAAKIQEMMQRMRELAVQAGSDTLQADDRAKLQEEFINLQREIDRTADTVTFNTLKLLNGDSSFKATLNSGATGISNVQTTSIREDIVGRTFTVSNFVQGNKHILQSNAYGSLNGTDAINGANGEGTLANGDQLVISDGTNTLTITLGVDVAVNATRDEFVNAVNNRMQTLGLGTFTFSGANEFEITGAKPGVTLTVSGNVATKLGVATSTAATASTVEVRDSSLPAGANLLVSGTHYTMDGDTFVGKAGTAYEGLRFDLSAGATGAITIEGGLSFQVGANAGEKITTAMGTLTTSALKIDAASIDITTKDKADAAVSALDDALSTVSTQRAKMGAIQNRLENTIANLQTQSENLTAANSRIRDLDMASEMAQFTKFQILSQASTAMLAQANQITQGVLSLLR